MINRKKAFTLAEVMIVFAVIGILTAILVPALFTATPDQRELRAKKGYNTFVRAIESLTNSEPYSSNDGILAAAPFIPCVSGDTGCASRRNSFLCNNLTEILNVSNVDCTKAVITDTALTSATSSHCSGSSGTNLCLKSNSTNGFLYSDLSNAIDTVCASVSLSTSNNVNNYNFLTSDGIRWAVQLNDFSNTNTVEFNGVEGPAFYNVICFNTDDGVSSDYNFGIAIRKDGKAVIGAKLQTELQREELNTDD